MAKLVTLERRAVNEPLYDVDPRTGAIVEIFYADRALAKSFSTRPGWHWWSCRQGLSPNDQPKGPFPTSYVAYRDTPGSPKTVAYFGKRPSCRQAVLTLTAIGNADTVRTRQSFDFQVSNLSI
jgi:hypothetical protein